MARQTTKKRKYRPRPGAVAAAARLGVTYSHLRRVLSGERHSHSLLVRYNSEGRTVQGRPTHMSNIQNPRFAQGAAPGADAPTGPIDPAAANTCIEWLDTVGKVGFTVVAVQAPYSAELWQNSGFEKALGNELAAANLGFYDSMKPFNPLVFFFYVPSKFVVAALEIIKARLAAICLLPHVTIGYADPESKGYRRVMFPKDGKAGA